MTVPQPIWSSFDSTTLVPLDSHEIRTIELACESYTQEFNAGLSEEYRPIWKASPLNLADLDYDFYEFGGRHWHKDYGYRFTSVWGQILVHSFGFEWMKMSGAETMRDWVLKHHEARFAFFPWQRLWQLVESCGIQHQKAEAAWLEIVDHVNVSWVMPTGWHVVADVLSGEANWVPQRIEDKLRRLAERDAFSYGCLGLHPYEWNPRTEWNNVGDWLDSLLTQ